MKYSKAIEIMMQLKAEYFNFFKDMPDELFKKKVENFMKALQDYTDTEVDVALGLVLRESKIVPTTAHFVEILERNRELLMPSVYEEWDSVLNVINQIKRNSECKDFDERIKSNKRAYETLSEDIKGYFINYSSFLDLLETKNLEYSKGQFVKSFPEYRKQKRKKEQLLKIIGDPNEVKL